MMELGRHVKSLLIEGALRSGSSRGADAEHRHATAGRCAAAADAARYPDTRKASGHGKCMELINVSFARAGGDRCDR